jgi:hypothetical protein
MTDTPAPLESGDAAALAAAVAAADAGRAAPGAMPPPGDQAAPPNGAELQAAMGAASMLVGFVADTVAARWPATAYTAEERLAAAAVLAPVFVKHGITPAWLEKWREEIAAAMAIGGLIYVGYQRVQAARAAPGPATPPAGEVIPATPPAP